MPKESPMAQISRPFQIALVAVVLLAGVWLFALQGHSSSSSSSPAPSPPSAAAQAKSAAAPTPVYHGAAPGVTGLSSAVAKAHGAVATSQQNAKQLEQQSAQASSATGAPASATASTAAPAPTTTKSSSVVVVHTRGGKAPHKGAVGTLPRQRLVEAELKAGDVVVLLFWDRKGSDDAAVHRAVQAVTGHGKVSVHLAPPSQVASFGSITRGVQVYGTPTVLVIGKAGQATVLTGLTDAYAIRQAIAEARSA
jgi:hypothetical protein